MKLDNLRLAMRLIVLALTVLQLNCKREIGNATSTSGQPKIGYTIHVINEFTIVAKRGAQDAAKKLNARIDVQGPPSASASAAIAIFDGMVQRRVDGLVTMPMPGDLWETPIRKAVESGIPVLTANTTSPGSPSQAWFGQDEYQSGIVLATHIRTFLSNDGKKEGEVVVGICAAGVPVLITRFEGLKKGMEGSGFSVTEPLEVEADKNKNNSRWEGLAGAHPKAVAMVGLCSMDLPNLAQIKTRTKASWIVAGYDLNVETLDGIRSGAVQVSIGQHPYLQGYLPVRALIEHVKEKKPLPSGWIDTGTEVVTKENVDSVYARETDEAAESKWYADYMAKNFVDLAAMAKPLPK